MGRGIAASRRRRRFTDQTVRRRVPQRIRPRPGAGRTRLFGVVRRAFTWDGWTKLGALATAIAAVGALIFTSESLRAANEQQRQAAKAQLAQQFTTASAQLGHESEHARMGGLYLLEQLAVDSDRYYKVAFEVIGAFLRDKAALRPDCSQSMENPGGSVVPRAPVEVQAALTVIGRRAIPEGGDEIDLSYTCLAGADLRHVRLSNASLTKVDLTKARLNGAILDGAILEGAKLSGADLSVTTAGYGGNRVQVSWQDVSRVPGADLRWANLAGADLIGARLDGADLQSASLEKAKLIDASLMQARLTDAFFMSADLRDADLYGADLSGAQLIAVQLQSAVMTASHLNGALLYQADLTNADLSGADLRGADLTEATLSGVDFGGRRTGCIEVEGVGWLVAAFVEPTPCEVEPTPWAIYDNETKWPKGFTPSWTSPAPPG